MESCKLMHEMEVFINDHGVTWLLEIVGNIASNKAEHLRVTQQDVDATRSWEKLSSFMYETAWNPTVRQCPLP